MHKTRRKAQTPPRLSTLPEGAQPLASVMSNELYFHLLGGNKVLLASAISIEIWDLAQQKRLRILAGDFVGINCFMLAPNDELIAFYRKDSSQFLKVWSLITGECVYSECLDSLAEKKAICELFVLPCGDLVFYCSDKIFLWNIKSRNFSFTFLFEHCYIFDVLQLPENKLICLYKLAASSSRNEADFIASICDGPSKIFLGYFKIDHYYSFLKLFPNGQLVMLNNNNGSLQIFHLLANGATQTLKAESAVKVKIIEMMPDGNLVTCAPMVDYTIRVWSVKTNKCVHILQGHTDTINALLVMSDDKLISASTDKTIRVWNVETGQCLQVLSDFYKYGQIYKLSAQLFAYTAVNSVIKIYNAQSKKCLDSVLTPVGSAFMRGQLNYGPANSILGVTPSGYLLLKERDFRIVVYHIESKQHSALPLLLLENSSCNWQMSKFFPQIKPGFLNVFDSATAKLINSLDHEDYHFCEILNESDNILVGYSPEGIVVVFDIESGKKLSHFPIGLCKTKLLSNGKMIALPCGLRQSAIPAVWNVRTGQCLGLLKIAPSDLQVFHTLFYVHNISTLHEFGKIASLLIELPGSQVASAINTQAIAIWDLKSLRFLRALSGHTSIVKKLQCLPTGELASIDSTSIKIWNINSGKCLATCSQQNVRDLLLLRENLIASVTNEGIISIWDKFSGKLLQSLKNESIFKLLLMPSGELGFINGNKELKVLNLQTSLIQTYADIELYHDCADAYLLRQKNLLLKLPKHAYSQALTKIIKNNHAAFAFKPIDHNHYLLELEKQIKELGKKEHSAFLEPQAASLFTAKLLKSQSPSLDALLFSLGHYYFTSVKNGDLDLPAAILRLNNALQDDSLHALLAFTLAHNNADAQSLAYQLLDNTYLQHALSSGHLSAAGSLAYINNLLPHDQQKLKEVVYKLLMRFYKIVIDASVLDECSFFYNIEHIRLDTWLNGLPALEFYEILALAAINVEFLNAKAFASYNHLVLYLALRNKSIETLQLFQKTMPHVYAEPLKDDWTPILIAAAIGDEKLLYWLLKNTCVSLRDKLSNNATVYTIPVTPQDANKGECRTWKLSVILSRKIVFFLPMLLKNPNVASVNSENLP